MMRRNRRALALVFSLTLGACGGEVREAAGLRLRCDLGCGPEGAALLQGMLAARDSVEAWFLVPKSHSTSVPKTTATVRLYGSVAAFERADVRLTQGRYRGQRAFSHADSRSAHILPEEAPDRDRWSRFGPGVAGPRLAIHEATHLAIYEIASDPRWPAWVAEGVAGLMEESWVRARGGGDPWLDTRDHVRQVLLQRGDLPGWEEIMNTSLDTLPLPSRYAVWAGFMEVLLSPLFRSETQEALTILATLRPGTGWHPATVREVFEAQITPASRRRIEEVFHERIRARTPRWVELQRGSQETAQGLLQVTADGQAALLWRLPERADAQDRACLEVSGFIEGPRVTGLALLLGQDEALAYGISIFVKHAAAPFSLLLGAEALSPSGAQPIPINSSRGSEIRLPSTGEFRFLLRREASSFTLRTDTGIETRWVLPTVGLGPGWGIGVLGEGAVMWYQMEAQCSF